MDTNDLEELAAAPEQPIVGIDTRIPMREKLLIPVIGTMCAFFNMLIQTYLIFNYTTYFKMDASYLRSMFTVVQLFSAVIAVTFAMYIDGHTTKWGKYKHWLLFVLAGTAVGTLLAFMPLGFGKTGNLIYATITYTIFSIFFSMNLAVRIGMTTAMTKRQDDRLELAISSRVWSLVFTYALSLVSPRLLVIFSGGKLLNTMSAPAGEQGMFFKLIIVYIIVFSVISYFVLKALKERFVTERREKTNIGLIAKSLFQNKYTLIAVSFALLQGLCSIVKSSTAIYYFMYFVGDTNNMALFLLLTTYPVLAGTLISPFVTKRLGIKKTVTIMLAINVISSAAAFFVPAGEAFVNVFYILSGLGYLCIGIAMPAHEAMLSAAADYGEWKYGAQSGAAIGAVSGLMQKLSSSANKMLPLYLGIIGFNSLSRQQSEAAIGGIRFAATLLPAILFAIIFLIVLRWDLTETRHREIVKEVYRR